MEEDAASSGSRDAAKQPSMHKTAVHGNESSGPDVSCVRKQRHQPSAIANFMKLQIKIKVGVCVCIAVCRFQESYPRS